MILLSILLSGLSAMFYRFGGMNPPFRSWMRDWVCPAFTIGTMFLWFKPDAFWGYFLAIPIYGIMGGSLSTYWDFLFGYDNFWFSGFMVGLSIFPLIFCGMAWWLVLIRAIVLAVIWGGVNYWVNKKKIPHSDWIEELARGFTMAITTVGLG